MMASSQKRTTVREDSKDMYLDQEYIDVEHLSIDEDLLTDVHIDFGQEQEDSVFDQSLMQYLDQLPIAPPPSAANYSASFIEMVLQDIEDFKEDNLYHGRDSQPAFDYEFDFNKSVSDLQLEEEEEHVVEQSRRYQEYFNEDEVPIQFTGVEDKSSRFAPTYKLSLSDFSLGYNNLVDPVIYQEQDEQPNFDQEQGEQPISDQEQDSFDDLLYEDNDSKDFSSWLCYDMDDENWTAHFKENIDYSQIIPRNENEDKNEYKYEYEPEYNEDEEEEYCRLSTEYPTEHSNHKDKDSCNENAHLDKDRENMHSNAEYPHLNQSYDAFLDQMEASVEQKAKYNNHSNSGPRTKQQSIPKSPPPPPPPQQQRQQQQQQLRITRSSIRSDEYKPTKAIVNIEKADFMFTAAKEPKRPTSFNDENTDSDFGFTDSIINTSTPIEKNRHQSYFTNNRVLRETYNKPGTSNSSLYFNTRSRKRSIVNKEKSESPKPTFNLKRKL